MASPAASGATQWVPLMDYAMETGISLSTLRRHIKANKIPYRLENGRYLLAMDKTTIASAAKSVAPVTRSAAPAVAQASFNLDNVQRELKKAREEIAELKTLIAFYEESQSPGKRS